MNSAELKRAKRRVRSEVLAARDDLPVPERDARSASIAERVMSLPELSGAPLVMVFWSFGSEVDTGPLIDMLISGGARLALPRIVDDDLEVRAFVPGDPVSATRFGAFEPTGGDVLDPSRVDVIVAPGVAFDRHGRRVGYGGGFYDRLFRRTRPDALRVGIGFDLQFLHDALPAGHFDLPLDVVVTEARTVRCVPAD